MKPPPGPARRRAQLVAGLFVLVTVLPGGVPAALAAAPPGPLALAAVPVEGPLERIPFPVHAHLTAGDGTEYALVAAPPRSLDGVRGARVLALASDPREFVIGLERRPGALAAVSSRFDVVHDDGRHVVVRASAGEADDLAAAGLDLQRLRAEPLKLGPRTALRGDVALASVSDPAIAAAVASVSQTAVQDLMAQLSGVQPIPVDGSSYVLTTRNTRSGTPIAKATQFAHDRLSALGLTTTFQPWTDSYSGTSGRNVVAELRGLTRPAEVVVIGAHIDDLPSGGPAPGADDDASGSAAVLLSAQALAAQGFERTVRFVLFTGEEQGLYGSEAYATLLASEGTNVVAALSLDMLGWSSQASPRIRLHTRTTSTPGHAADLALGAVFEDAIATYLPGALVPVRTADGESGSDHSSFWAEGWPALLVIEDDYDDLNPYYHTASDTAGVLDFPYLTSLVKATVAATALLGQRSAPAGPPSIATFTASPVLVTSGSSSTLAWSTSGATSVTLGGSPVAGSGTRLVTPSVTTSYTLVAANASGSASAAVTVSVGAGTGAQGAPVITAPAPGATLATAGVTASWTGVPSATGFDVRVFASGSGAPVFTGTLAGGGAASTLVSLRDGSWVLAVRACGGGTFTDASCGPFATRDFAVGLAAPAGAPTVTAPTQGAALTTSTQTFGWTAVARADASQPLSYEVLLTDVAAGKPELQISVPDPGLDTIYSLHGSTQYELKVRACQAACGPWSTPVTFSVSLPAVPAGLPEITGCSVSGGNSMACSWTAVARADLYQLMAVQPSSGPGGGALTVAARQVSTTSATVPVPSGLANVIVRACNGDGCGAWSPPVGVSPSGPSPAAPNLGTPMAGTVVDGPVVTFTWNRVPGDDGTNVLYRLYVQDLSRQSAALDVTTTQNYWAAYLKAEGARYDALVIASPGLPAQVTGPAQGFNVRGSSATAPTVVTPAHQSSVKAGNVQLGWSPVPGGTLYEYFVAVQGQPDPSVRGVTPGLVVQVPLPAAGGAPTTYSAIGRTCPAGATCAPGSDAGWGPWSNAAGVGVTSFSVVP